MRFATQTLIAVPVPVLEPPKPFVVKDCYRESFRYIHVLRVITVLEMVIMIISIFGIALIFFPLSARNVINHWDADRIICVSVPVGGEEE